MFYFHLFTCSCPVFPVPLIEETIFFPIVCFCLFCHRLTDHIGVWIYVWGLQSVPLISVAVFWPAPCCFDYSSFIA